MASMTNPEKLLIQQDGHHADEAATWEKPTVMSNSEIADMG